MLLSTKTMSWPLTPGTGLHFWISEGLNVMKTSSVFSGDCLVIFGYSLHHCFATRGFDFATRKTNLDTPVPCADSSPAVQLRQLSRHKIFHRHKTKLWGMLGATIEYMFTASLFYNYYHIIRNTLPRTCSHERKKLLGLFINNMEHGRSHLGNYG